MVIWQVPFKPNERRMYQALDLKKALPIFTVIVATFAVAVWLIRQPEKPIDYLETILSASSVVSALLLGLGESPLFRALWRCEFIQRNFFPYIHGTYRGTISSNWSVIEALRERAASGERADLGKMDVTTLGPHAKPVRVEIRASFLRASMKVIPDDNYSDSHTVSFRPVLDGEEGYPIVFYLYRTTVIQPLATDSGASYGAARLNVISDKERKIRLKGTYWTDRNWTKGMNTAGVLEAEKVE